MSREEIENYVSKYGTDKSLVDDWFKYTGNYVYSDGIGRRYCLGILDDKVDYYWILFDEVTGKIDLLSCVGIISLDPRPEDKFIHSLNFDKIKENLEKEGTILLWKD